MTEQEIADYKAQMFNGNGQSSIQPPTPPPIDTPPAPVVEEPVVVTPPVIAPVDTPPPIEEKIVDVNEHLEKELGFKDWEAAKAAIAELKQKAETPAEIKFVNEQSQKLFDAIREGKMDDVYEVLAEQRMLSKVEEMSADEALKLHIQHTNKHYKKDDVADVFEEKYAYPDKPVQGDLEEDTDFNAKISKWEEAKAKIDRRKERDAITAKSELSKLKTELVFPEINKANTGDEAAKEHQKKQEDALLQLKKLDQEAYSKMSPKDVTMVFKFNDEASKLAFDISYEPDKDSFDAAVQEAADLDKFFDNYYAEDGSPKRTELLKHIYAGKNIEKIVSEAVKEATNQTKAWFLKNQKNIGDGTQRNYYAPPQTDVQKLKEQVFGKAS